MSSVLRMGYNSLEGSIASIQQLSFHIPPKNGVARICVFAKAYPDKRPIIHEIATDEGDFSGHVFKVKTYGVNLNNSSFVLDLNDLERPFKQVSEQGERGFEYKVPQNDERFNILWNQFFEQMQ
ncbi:MAG: hypothetical protein JSS32_08185 [Verrucomicrobia bacterium]|nr:hypothetical protein [Verrucomicrobiota bacterium]